MNVFKAFRPKLIENLRGYRSQSFLPDLTARGTVGIVALHLAMALAIAAAMLEPDHALLAGPTPG